MINNLAALSLSHSLSLWQQNVNVQKSRIHCCTVPLEKKKPTRKWERPQKAFSQQRWDDNPI